MSHNSKHDICSPGEKDKEMYYGQLEEMLEFSYMSFKVVLFRVKWFDTRNEGRKIKRFIIRNNITQIWARGESFKDDQYILETQVKQVFYLENMARQPPDSKVVQDVNHKKVSNGGVIVVEDDHDVIYFDNSSDLALSTSLDDLDFATLNIDGQSMDVDAPPYIIDVDEDDDLIDDEDALPHNLEDSDDEYVSNDDDDDISADVARGHDGDGDGDDHPPPGKGTQKPNRGGRKASRLDTRKQTRNLRLRRITDQWGSQPIWFDFNDKGTLMPLGDHATHWTSRCIPFLAQYRVKEKAGVIGNIMIAFWLDPKNLDRAAQNAQNLAKSTMESSATREYSSLIQTYFDIQTVNDVFLQDEERLLYKEMLRLKDLGPNMPSGVPYTNDEIVAIVRRGKQRGYIPGVGRVLAGHGKDVLAIPESRCVHPDDVDELQPQHEVGSSNASGKAGDDEPGEDEDASKDEDVDDDEDS
uniref:DUF4216 domain-containing protein n=1 Tax=Tanacetum cinerariifolium TaxID=118510 RepID=A0A6L2MPF0_TANCI|nr:hypothetical protein [Tanacetum cinerariifolium]